MTAPVGSKDAAGANVPAVSGCVSEGTLLASFNRCPHTRHAKPRPDVEDRTNAAALHTSQGGA